MSPSSSDDALPREGEDPFTTMKHGLMTIAANIRAYTEKLCDGSEPLSDRGREFCGHLLGNVDELEKRLKEFIEFHRKGN
jgi:hypothetical protein